MKFKSFKIFKLRSMKTGKLKLVRLFPLKLQYIRRRLN
jgi:hypothetical protein